MRRVLSVSLSQAMKGVALTLFPSAFIALLAWATAGSANGSTTDPMRGAVWLWLALHLTPFKLTATTSVGHAFFSILPLAGMFFPMAAIRRTFAPVLASAPTARAARIFYTTFYTLIVIALAIAAASSSVIPMWYYAGLCAALICVVSTISYKPRPHFAVAYYLFAIAWGVGAVAVGLSLLAHWSVLQSMNEVIQPGIIGGVLFLAVQILYLPNVALASMAYMTGSGMSLGAHTLITPIDFVLNNIPAVPLFAALPTGKHPFLMVGIIFWPLLFTAVVVVMKRTIPSGRRFNIALLRTLPLMIWFVWELCYFASGELLTPEMKRTGVLPERTASVAAISALVALTALLAIPKVIERISKARASE